MKSLRTRRPRGGPSWLLFAPLFVALAAGQGSCGSTTSHGGPVVDHPSFVDQLRALGYTVEIEGEVEQPFLSAEEGTRIKVTGPGFDGAVELQSFHYVDSGQARDDARELGPEGQPKTMHIGWVAPPHFFRADKLIVLYLGDDAAVLETLTDILGDQFAGD